MTPVAPATDPIVPERRPDPCARCGSDAPLTETARAELYFYTGAVSVIRDRFVLGTDHEPRGRLCEECTAAFVEFLKKAQP